MEEYQLTNKTPAWTYPEMLRDIEIDTNETEETELPVWADGPDLANL